MSKEQILEIIKLLSSMESWSFSVKNNMPSHIYEQITECQEYLQQELFK